MSSFTWGFSTGAWQPQILPRKTLTAYTVTEGYDAYNRPTGKTLTPFTLKNCSIQPVSGNEKITLPEGLKEKVTYKLYTSTKVKTVDYDDYTLADRVDFNGDRFIVIKVQDWDMSVQSHVEAYLIKDEEVIAGGDE